MEKFCVTIISANKEDKTYSKSIECNTLIDVSRLVLAFRPKRGYETVHYSIQKIQTLF